MAAAKDRKGKVNTRSDSLGLWFVRVENRFMVRPLAKSPFVLLALGLWLLTSLTSLAKDDDLPELNERIYKLFQEGQFQEAVPLAQKAVAIARRLRGPEHPDTALSLNNLAAQYLGMGEFTKAEPLLQEALQIYRKVGGEEHSDTAVGLNNLGDLYEQMGEYAKAEPLYQKALQIYRKVGGEEQPDTALSLNNLGDLYEAMGEYPKAEPLLEEALRIYQKVRGKEHPETALCLINLAELYKAMAEYAKAEPLLLEALRICRKVRGEEHSDTALSLNNLGDLYEEMGEYAKAETLYLEALRIYQKVRGEEHLETAASLGNLAELYLKMGEFSKAEPLFQEALRIDQKVFGPEHPDTANSLDNLAALYDTMGEFAKAEPLYQEALRIDEKVLGPEHSKTATSINNLASFYYEMGEYARAEPLLQESFRICQKVLGSEHPQTAASLEHLAGLYLEMREFAKAEPLLQEALRIRKKVFGSEHPETAASLSSLGQLYQDQGKYAQAESLLQEALRIRKKVFGSEHPITAESLNNLALLYWITGEYVKAETLYQESLRFWQKIIGPEHPDTATVIQNLALLEFDLGRIDEATALARQASAAQLTSLSRIFSFTSEQQRLAYLDIFHPYWLFAILTGTETDLATAVLRYKGVVLDSIVEDHLLAEAVKGSEDQKLVEQLNLGKRQLGQLLLQPAKTFSTESNRRIEALEGEVEKIESQLAQRVAGLGQARHALGVSLEQVQLTIPNDGALIEYLRYKHYLGEAQLEPSYGAVVLFSKGAPLWIPLGKAEVIDDLVTRYSTLVRGSPEEEELSANLQALDEAVWAPIAQALPNQTKRIIISPDGELNFVSFATLLSKDKEFLAQTYDVQYVASGRDLLRQVTPSTAKDVVLFANPDFDLASTAMLAKADNPSADEDSPRGAERGDIEDWSFASLEGTQKETDELIKKFARWGWTLTDFTGEEATKEALLKIHSPYILHLATHGFFAKEDPTSAKTETESSLNERQSVAKSKFFKNPMHRSGLALTGAQSTIEAWKRGEVPPVENDGILTAEDVSTLDLQGTWLVTLSACDTGAGEARAGEGVMGLRRGFIQAGAQNLLMTLWPISDEFTVQIMRDFYEAAHTNDNAPAALAKVQRDWLVKLRSEQGLASAVNLAGPFIMSFQGRLGPMAEPSVSASSPLAIGTPSPTPSEWLAEAQRYLDGKDFAKALALLQKAAADGQAAAMDNLGVLYRDGNGVTQDYRKALQWFQKAADAGDADAMNHLGWLYDGGKDVAQNSGRAREWYQKAADAGNTDAMYNLGVMYQDGQGVTQDYGKASDWYRKAADAGDTDAMNNLGMLYCYARGVAQDYLKARDWYQKAAGAGDKTAMYNLGVLYRDGQGVAQSYGKAREWFQKAADAGDTDAMANLGALYANGKGGVQDYGKAREWYQKAADAGLGIAQQALKALRPPVSVGEPAIPGPTAAPSKSPH
jgi:TPR repeat protein/CHAT domain-containing protein